MVLAPFPQIEGDGWMVGPASYYSSSGLQTILRRSAELAPYHHDGSTPHHYGCAGCVYNVRYHYTCWRCHHQILLAHGAQRRANVHLGYQRKHASQLGNLRSIGLVGVMCQQALHSAARCRSVGVLQERVSTWRNEGACEITIMPAMC